MIRLTNKDEKGFTLIEMTVTLILVGILAVIGSFGLVNIVKGYVTSRVYSEAAQKGQIALLQVTKLLTYAKVIHSGATSTSLTFDTYDFQSSVSTTTCTLVFNNGKIMLGEDTLIDHVHEFKFGYYNGVHAAEQSTWSAQTKIIEITMRLDLGQGELSPEFKTRITPRNVAFSSI